MGRTTTAPPVRKSARVTAMPSQDAAVLAPMVESLREHVARAGLDRGETQQVGARLPAELVRRAKRRTGLSSNTDLLIFALATVAVEDSFADAFEAAHGTLDPDLDIGF